MLDSGLVPHHKDFGLYSNCRGKWLDEAIGRVRAEMVMHLVAHGFYVE